MNRLDQVKQTLKDLGYNPELQAQTLFYSSQRVDLLQWLASRSIQPLNYMTVACQYVSNLYQVPLEEQTIVEIKSIFHDFLGIRCSVLELKGQGTEQERILFLDRLVNEIMQGVTYYNLLKDNHTLSNNDIAFFQIYNQGKIEPFSQEFKSPYPQDILDEINQFQQAQGLVENISRNDIMLKVQHTYQELQDQIKQYEQNLNAPNPDDICLETFDNKVANSSMDIDITMQSLTQSQNKMYDNVGKIKIVYSQELQPWLTKQYQVPTFGIGQVASNIYNNSQVLKEVTENGRAFNNKIDQVNRYNKISSSNNQYLLDVSNHVKGLNNIQLE